MILRAPYIYVNDVDKLRDNTKVGDTIEFMTDKYARYDGYDHRGFKDTKKIKAVVKAKYPNVFVLDDGQIFSWVEYIIGKIALQSGLY